MALLPIYVAPHPVLKKIAEPVSSVTDSHRKLVADMFETMYASSGIGLAAPQVGVSERILVLDVEQKDEEEPQKRPGNPRAFINPEIIWSSEELNVYDEGCLSVPGQYAPVERPLKIRVKFLDADGVAREIDADGLLATCLQHEMDHLNGILFVDHLSTLKRDMLLRKLKKWTKENAEEIARTHVL